MTSTALSAALGLLHPLIQAPMAGAQDARLAQAVRAAGALGSIPGAMLDAAGLERQMRLMQPAGASMPEPEAAAGWNVNFFCHRPAEGDAQAAAERQRAWRQALAPFYAELGLDPEAPVAAAVRRPFDASHAEVLEAFRPPVVSFHFGLPEPALLARVKARGALVVSSATTVEEGLWLQAHGADAVIAQGLEAGGHRGHFLQRDVAQQAPLGRLLPALVEALDVPVIAAGGLSSRAQVQWALGQGAAAVQVGTAFLRCDEALTSPLHRARLADPDAPTVLTHLFSGGLARGLSNRLIESLGPLAASVPPFPEASIALAPLRAAAEALGRDDFTPLWSGTDRSGCRAAPAAAIVQALMDAGLALTDP